MILNGFHVTFLVMNWRQIKMQNSTLTCFIAATCWSLVVQENPERGAFVSIRRDRLWNQEKPSCSLARPGVSFKYGQLTNQIVPYDRPTNQIVPFVGEQDISKEQGLAAGVPSPLLPPPPSSNFCRNTCNAGNVASCGACWHQPSDETILFCKVSMFQFRKCFMINGQALPVQSLTSVFPKLLSTDITLATVHFCCLIFWAGFWHY